MESRRFVLNPFDPLHDQMVCLKLLQSIELIGQLSFREELMNLLMTCRAQQDFMIHLRPAEIPANALLGMHGPGDQMMSSRQDVVPFA